MVKIGIVGGTGYTGVELLRLLASHPEADVRAITSRGEAGTRVVDMFPSLRGHYDALSFTAPDATDLRVVRRRVLRDAARRGDGAGARAGRRRREDHRSRRRFPHPRRRRCSRSGTRCRTRARTCSPRRSTACPEFHRDEIRKARIVGNPGCYPTAMQLGFMPLLEAGVVDSEHLIADCKSGVSGAGRKAEIGLLLAEASDNFKAYGVAGHRHHPETVQELAGAQRDAGEARLHAASRCR